MIAHLNYLKELIIDFFQSPQPDLILTGKKYFRPFLNYQHAWFNYIYPNDQLNLNKSTWFYLQKYLMPMIKKNASSYHLQGIRLLHLDLLEKPDFCIFQKQFSEISYGFELIKVNDEIDPERYFTWISKKKFPCIESIRSHNELFCGNEPDFWHEAIGHIAPLCFPEVQLFYVNMADWILNSSNEKEFHSRLAVAWTIMEYGFLREGKNYKMFGAALVGSHLANIRFLRGLIDIEKAHYHTILQSGFYEVSQSIPFNDNGNFRFFGIDKLGSVDIYFNQRVVAAV